MCLSKEKCKLIGLSYTLSTSKGTRCLSYCSDAQEGEAEVYDIGNNVCSKECSSGMYEVVTYNEKTEYKCVQ